MQYSVPWTSLSMVLGIAMSGTPLSCERLGEAERVVAADGHQVVEAQALDVLEHDGRQVVESSPSVVIVGRLLGGEVRAAAGRARILPRVGPRGVEHRAAGPVDGPRVDAVEGHDVARVGRARRALVGQALPAAADAEDLVAELGGAVGDALDDAVEAGDVAAAGQDADASWLGPSARHSPVSAPVARARGCVADGPRVAPERGGRPDGAV